MIRLLKEQDVNIEVKHEGILEVPEGKNVDDLPMSHFEKLVKKKGLSKITKALNNLQVWNKKKDPKLSKWAGDMIDKLNKKLKKDESLKESHKIPIGWKERTITVDDDEQEAAVEEILAYAKRDNDKIEWDVDYNGGMFGGSRVFYIYSDGDTFSEVQYTVEQMKDDAIYGRGIYEMARPSYSKLKESYSEDDWWSSIPKDLWDVVAEMESLGWEAVGYVSMGVDYCISTESPTRPELSFEMCVHITSPEFSADNTSIPVGKWIEVYDWNNDKNLPDIPNDSGVYEFRTPQDVRKFTQWFKRLGASY